MVAFVVAMLKLNLGRIPKQNIYNTLKKTLSHLARVTYLRVFIWKIFVLPRWDPGKFKWDSASAGWLTSPLNTLCIYRSFLKMVRSHLGEPAYLNESRLILRQGNLNSNPETVNSKDSSVSSEVFRKSPIT